MKWISKIVDMPKLIKRVWLILWAMLFIAVFMKFCFNIWYPIVVESPIVIKIGDFIDSNKVLTISIMLIFYVLNNNFWFLTSIGKIKYKKISLCIIMNILMIIGCFMKLFNNFIGLIYEMATFLILIPIIINIRNKTFSNYRHKNKLFVNLWNILYPIIIYLIINIWQSNMVFVRGIQDVLTDMPFIISLALQIDYYIFMIITWIGGYYIMGSWGGGWWWNKATTELEAIKAAELKKANPDAKLIADIDKELERRTNEIKNKAA